MGSTLIYTDVIRIANNHTTIYADIMSKGYTELDVVGYEEIVDTPSSRGCFKFVLCGFFIGLGILIFLGAVTIFIVMLPPNKLVSGMITVVNDYNQDVLVTWMRAGPWIKYKRWEEVKKKTRLMPKQSDGCKSDEAGGGSEVVTKIYTQIYVNNQWGNRLSYILPNGVYTANYTVSQIRGPRSSSRPPM
jgi:hypothetical protein